MSDSFKNTTDQSLQDKFRAICLNLTMRDDNTHIGFNAGGSQDKLLTLLSKDNVLVDSGPLFVETETEVSWNKDLFASTKSAEVIKQIQSGDITKSSIETDPSSKELFAQTKSVVDDIENLDKKGELKQALEPLVLSFERSPYLAFLMFRNVVTISNIVKYNIDEQFPDFFEKMSSLITNCSEKVLKTEK